MKRIHPVILLFLLVFSLSTAAAQTDDICPSIVDAALAAVDDACLGIGRNQACYGNVILKASPRDDASAFKFDAPGDLVDVGDVQALTLESMNTAQNIWGVALMKLQASLPDTQPGQNLTFLLFGDVEIENAVESNTAPPTLTATANGDINVRGAPSTNGAVVDSLAAGETITLVGRLEDSSWLRLEAPDGWVRADLVSVDGDASILDVLAPDGEVIPVLNPMQAFYFKTGIGDSVCAEAPNSGLLIQTPAGAGTVSFRANEVDITLGSTIYLQADITNLVMTVSVVEGQAELTALGVTVIAPAGTQVEIPIDANRAASGPPGNPTPYNAADLAALPVGHLPRLVTVASLLDESAITPEATETPAAPLPVAGITADQDSLTLPVGGTQTIHFTLRNIGGDAAPAYVDVSVSPGLDIVGGEPSSVWTRFDPGADIWHADECAPRPDEYLLYSAEEALLPANAVRQYAITVTATAAGAQWIRYRASLKPDGAVNESDCGDNTFVRDPGSGATDQQNWHAYVIPVTVES